MHLPDNFETVVTLLAIIRRESHAVQKQYAIGNGAATLEAALRLANAASLILEVVKGTPCPPVSGG